MIVIAIVRFNVTTIFCSTKEVVTRPFANIASNRYIFPVGRCQNQYNTVCNNLVKVAKYKKSDRKMLQKGRVEKLFVKMQRELYGRLVV